MKKRIGKALIIALIVLMNVGCDQGTKSIARSRLKDKPPAHFIHSTVILQWVENEGAFLSLGAGLPKTARRIVFIAFPLAVLAYLVFFVMRDPQARALPMVALSFITGGGFGNLIDRLMYDGRVGDFINIGIGDLRNPGIFNLADLSILAGCLLLLACQLHGRRTAGPNRMGKT